MKRFSKALLLTLLAVAMVLNTCGIVLANTDSASVAIREEKVTDSVKKLVFKATAPDNNIKTTSFVFSYDNTVIQPVTADGTAAEVKDAFVAGTGLTLTPVGDYVDKANNRTGVRVDTYSVEGVNTEAGKDIVEFYFKANGTVDRETFKVEEEYADGSILKAFYPKNAGIASAIKVGSYNSKAGTATYELNYEGKDNASLDLLTVAATDETGAAVTAVNVPALYPTAGAVEEVTLTATGKDTTNAEYDVSAATWSLEQPIEGVTIEGNGTTATLKVAPGAKEDKAIVVAQCGKIKSNALEIEINRETLTPAIIRIDGEDFPAFQIPNESEPNNEVYLKADVYHQYGDKFTQDGETFTFELAEGTQGVEFIDPNKLKITSATVAGSTIKVNVTSSIHGEINQEPITITFNGFEVNWNEIIVPDTIVYGTTNTQAVKFTDGKPVHNAEGKAILINEDFNDEVEGVYTVDKPDDKLNAKDEQQFISVTFKVTDERIPEAKRMSLTKAFPVTVTPAGYDMEGIKIANQDTEYTGEPVHLGNWVTKLPEGVSVADVTYTLNGEEVVNPMNAGTYDVVIEFTVEDSENYETPASITTTLKIEKAQAVISAATTQMLDYNATAQYVAAGIVKGEGALVYSPAQSFTDAGTYNVTITLPESENYKEATKDVVVTINKADAVSYEYADTERIMTAKEAAEKYEIDSIEDLQTYLELPETVDVKISSNATKNVAMTWEAEEDAEWDVKGGTYVFTATPNDADKKNINFNVVEAEDGSKTDLELTVTVKVLPVTAKIVNVNGKLVDNEIVGGKDVAEGEELYKNNITVHAKPLADATTYKELGIPETLIVMYDWTVEEETTDSTEGGEQTDAVAETTEDTTVKYEEVTLTWSKTLEELKALAVGSEVTIEMTTDLSRAYATIEGADDIIFKVAADDKKIIGFAVEISDRKYGDEASAAKVTLSGEDSEGLTYKDYTVTYIGKTDGGVEYNSEEVPTQAGEYTVRVEPINAEIYDGFGSATFKVTPKEVDFVIADVTKVYADANPTFECANVDYAIQAIVFADRENEEGTLGKIIEKVLGVTYNCADTKSWTVGEYKDVISATKSNPNYSLNLTKGSITVVPKYLESEDIVAPVINGKLTDGMLTIGDTITVNPVTGIDTDQYTWQWTADGVDIEDATNASYIPAIADSNKVVAVKMIAIGGKNYSGIRVSEGYRVAKYVISGKVGVTITDNGTENKLDAGDIVTVDVTTIKDYEKLSEAGIAFDYQWYLNDNEIVDATNDFITIPAGERGVLTVKVTATGDFEGSITVAAGEIGKTALTGAITLAETDGVITADLTGITTGVAGTDYDVKWYRGKTDITADVKGNAYTITDADYGQTITVKAVAKDDDPENEFVATYAGEIVATYNVAAKAPSNVTISTSTTSTSIAVTLTAKANGAAIKYFDVEIKAADIVAGTAKVYADSKGEYKHTFGSLTTGTTYTIKAVANNGIDDSKEITATATPASSGGSGSGGGGGSAPSTKPEDTTSTDSKEATVTVSGSEAKVDATTIKGKETLTTNLTTSEGTEVGVTVNVADTAINKVTVSAEKSDAEVTGKAADGAIGAPIEVKVEAVDAKGNEVGTAAATVKLSSDKEAHGYIVDALGNTVRADSTYDAETGTVTISGVANGAVVVLSTTAPAEFADIEEGRWSETEINKASDLGLVNGTGAGRFAPAENLTRYQAMQISFNKVVHVLGMDLEKNAETKIDTDKAHWAFEAASYSASTGIFNGTGALEDGTFVMSGEDTITRGQYFTAMARLMQRVLPDDHTAEGVNTVFEDAAEIADYAAEPIAYLVKLGIVGGTKTATGYVVNANDNITREEAAAISVRIYNYLAKVIAK